MKCFHFEINRESFFFKLNPERYFFHFEVSYEIKFRLWSKLQDINTMMGNEKSNLQNDLTLKYFRPWWMLWRGRRCWNGRQSSANLFWRPAQRCRSRWKPPAPLVLRRSVPPRGREAQLNDIISNHCLVTVPSCVHDPSLTFTDWPGAPKGEESGEKVERERTGWVRTRMTQTRPSEPAPHD